MPAERRTTDDLVRIAEAPGRQRIGVGFTGLTNCSIDELRRIAVVGQIYASSPAPDDVWI